LIVEFFTKPNCVQCVQTKKQFDKYGIEYRSYNVVEDTEAYQFVTERLGYSAAPVIAIMDEDGNVLESWSGFIPEKIDLLIRN